MTSISRIQVADPEAALQLCRQIEGHAGDGAVSVRLSGDRLEIACPSPLPLQLLGAGAAALAWLWGRARALVAPRSLGMAAAE